MKPRPLGRGASDYAKVQEEFLLDSIKKYEQHAKELWSKGGHDQAEAVEKYVLSLQSRLGIVKTQNRMLLYKPAAVPAAPSTTTTTR